MIEEDTAIHAISPVYQPDARATVETLEKQRNLINCDDLVSALMQALPGYAMLINQQRQILSVNPHVLRITGVPDVTVLVGRRPGEALNCIHAEDTPGGCGTGEHCTVCGAVLAILDSQRTGEQAVRECHVTLKGASDAVIDLKATATPLVIQGEHLTLFSLQDISDEKRREVLERTFFHDIMNTAGGLHGLATMLAEHQYLPSHLEHEYKGWLVEMSGNLVEEIAHQRNLLMAERGEYQPQLAPVAVRDVLDQVHRLYRHHGRSPGREVVVAEVPDCTIMTDLPVLRRILGNMVINALEATPIGETVTLFANRTGGNISINVHNLGVMQRDVQLQVFTRSFSTKSGSGHGIGTYSMKLFGERYLKGVVSFRSMPDEGTIFTIMLPIVQ